MLALLWMSMMMNIELKRKSDEMTLTFCLEYKEHLKKWMEANDKVLCLLVNFVRITKKLELFLGSVKARDSIGIECKYSNTLLMWKHVKSKNLTYSDLMTLWMNKGVQLTSVKEDQLDCCSEKYASIDMQNLWEKTLLGTMKS